MSKKPDQSKKSDTAPATPGPKPDNLKIDGMTWEDAVKKSLGKKKPATGWPK